MLIDTVRELFARRPIPSDEITTLVLDAATRAAEQDLAGIVYLTEQHGFLDEIVAGPAIVALPAWGARGITHIHDLIRRGINDIEAYRVLLTLAIGEVPTVEGFTNPPTVSHSVPEESFVVARRVVRDLALEQVTDRNLRSRLMMHALFGMSAPENRLERRRSDYLVAAINERVLVVNKPLIDTFRELLDREPDRESVLHEFLVAHPVFLDPLAEQVVSKHELGSEFQTDFVVRRINNEYVLVEIEKSTDRLFTASGNLHSDLTEAIRQVADFQAWVHDNIAYARTRLPDIRRPEGLIIIGRRESLDEASSRRLDEENFSRRGHIRIVTFDDVLDQAETIYRNMIEGPVVFRGKKPVS